MFVSSKKYLVIIGLLRLEVIVLKQCSFYIAVWSCFQMDNASRLLLINGVKLLSGGLNCRWSFSTSIKWSGGPQFMSKLIAYL